MEPKTINATKLRIETRDLMEQVKFHGQRFIVETFGRPMAVIISIEDYHRVKGNLLELEGAKALDALPATANANTSRRKKDHASRHRLNRPD